ncbi:hypothetical protein HN587_06000 [Candidatus Woesearchaeota archaeon]|nr:hypothetical protein [Candidatus Woesearchaeota archaeon]
MRSNKNAELLSVVAVIALIGSLIAAAIILPGDPTITGMAVKTPGQTLACGDTLATENGVYTLDEGLACTGNGFYIGANNVTLDCGGFEISGDYALYDQDYGINIFNVGYQWNYTTIRNCDISGFVINVILFDNVRYSNFTNNTFHDSTDSCIHIQGDYNLFFNNSIYDCNTTKDHAVVFDTSADNNNFSFNILDNEENGKVDVSLSNADSNNFVGNTFSDMETNINVTGSSTNNQFWLNTFLSGNVNDVSAGTSYYCGPVTSELTAGRFTTSSNYYGNYYVEGVEMDAYPCSNLTEAYSPETLPPVCGVTVIGNLILTENLTRATGESTCSGNGLNIGEDNLNLDCDDHLILGDGTQFNFGVDLFNNPHSNITINNCIINNFSYGIGASNNADYLRVFNTNLNNVIYGIQQVGEYGLFENNTINSTTGSGVYLQGGNNNSFINNVFINAGNSKYDLDLNSGEYNNFSNNIFYGNGILDNGNNNFCINGVGNNYTLTAKNFPASFDCGYAWIGDGTSTFCNSDLTVEHTYLVDNITSCSTNGLNINANNVALDCAGFAIQGITDRGIEIDQYVNNSVITNCLIMGNFDMGVFTDEPSVNISIINNSISGSSYGIYLDSNLSLIENNSFINSTISGIGVVSSSNIIYNNYFNSSGNDLAFIENNEGNLVSNNLFLKGIGEDYLTNNTFCQNNTGNFHPAGATIPDTECGLKTSPPIDAAFETSEDVVNLTWNSVGNFDAITYQVDLYKNDTGVEGTFYGSVTLTDTEVNNYFEWTPYNQITYGDPQNTSFYYNVTPLAYGVIGFTNQSDFFNVSKATDYDNDSYFIPQDCNDNNPAVNPGALNHSNSSVDHCTDLADRLIDWDCDGDIGWDEPDCGEGFNQAEYTYNFTLIDELDSAENVLLENTYGSIEFLETINFKKMNLNYATIEQNSISVDSVLLYNLANKQVQLNLTNLSYEQIPALLRNGVLCNNSICPSSSRNYTNGIFSTQVNSFSNYSTTNNSKINTYTENGTLETYHRIWFYANYTKFFITDQGNDLSGQSINDQTGGDDFASTNNGSCTISISQSWNGLSKISNTPMIYDSNFGVYKFNNSVTNFTAPGVYNYNINCTSNKFENQSLSSTFTLVDDVTAPIAPILYKQIWLHPTNQSDNSTTVVAGYYDESDIESTIVILRVDEDENYEFSVDTQTNSEIYSTYEGESITLNYHAEEGQNVVLVEWTAEREDAFLTYDYVTFSNHDKTYFQRYAIDQANRTGNDIRVNFTDNLESIIPVGTQVTLYSTEYPSGHFQANVSLYGGVNRISVWGTDKKGNSGSATDDFINHPTGPVEAIPKLWDLPSVENEDFNVIGYIDEESLTHLNITVVIKDEDNEVSLLSQDVNNTSNQLGVLNISSNHAEGASYVFVSQAEYDSLDISESAWANYWVEFSNHDRTYWQRYNVTEIEDNPGEDPRIILDPTLESSVTTSADMVIHSAEWRHGFFNVSINISGNLTANQTNEIYAVGVKNETEGYKSISQYVYYDAGDAPVFYLGEISNVSASTETFIEFNVSDNNEVNISSLWINASKDDNFSIHAVSPESVNDSLGLNMSEFEDNILCSEINTSYYSCNVTLVLFNGTNNVKFNVSDYIGTEKINVTEINVILTNVSIGWVRDYNNWDVTSKNWIWANWTLASGSEDTDLDYYQVSVGKDPSLVDKLNWVNISKQTKEINITHTGSEIESAYNFTFLTNEVYYFNVRAVNLAGATSAPVSSDGILYIDDSAPACEGNCVSQGASAWANSQSSLNASWNFTDAESEIIGYEYSIGTGTNEWEASFDSVHPLTQTSQTSVLVSNLILEEGVKYYFNVRAKSGNSFSNYSSGWSEFFSSAGITTDFTEPVGGAISYVGGDYDIESVDIFYNSGGDNGSGLDNGLDTPSNSVAGIKNVSLWMGTSSLPVGLNNTCPPIYDFNLIHYLTPSNGLAESIEDVNLISGKCHAFKLHVYDGAGNLKVYDSGAIQKVMKSDLTGPTLISSVTDQGFQTFDSSYLHASWTPSSDPETGIDHYAWEILQYNPEDDQCGGDIPNSCPAVSGASGNVTNSEVSVSGLSLDNQIKYYFKITPYNGFNNPNASTYSNGIIYIDNSAPTAPEVYQINDDSNPGDGWIFVNETDKDVTINFNAEEASECVLTYVDIGYSSNENIQECDNFTLTNYSCTNTTVNRFNVGGEISTGGQGNFTWYISCRDSQGVAQDHTQNTNVNFIINWPDAPQVFNVTVNNSDGEFVYADSIAFCSANYTDQDNNVDSALFQWFDDGVNFENSTNLFLSGNFTSAELNLSEYSITRDSTLSCAVNIADETERTNSSSGYVRVSNSAPAIPELIGVSNNTKTNSDIILSWNLTSDLDDDYFIYSIEIDNETSFNYSDNELNNFSRYEILTPSVATIADPDVFGDIIVWADNRSGDWNIFSRNIVTNNTAQITTTTSAETMPKIYKNKIYYQKTNGAQKDLLSYDLTTSKRSEVVTDFKSNTYDVEGNNLIYVNDSGIFNFKLDSLELVMINGVYGADAVSVKGGSFIWGDGSSVWMHDLQSNKSGEILSLADSESKLSMKLDYAGDNLSVFPIVVSSYSDNNGGTAVYFGNNNSFISYPEENFENSYFGDYSINNSLDGFFINQNNNQLIDESDSVTDYGFSDNIVVATNGSKIWIYERDLKLPTSIFISEPTGATAETFEVDTSNSEDGTYYWRVVACDNAVANNSCVYSTTRQFELDRTNPSVEFVFPDQDDIISGVVEFQTTITDNNAITERTYQVKYANNTNITYDNMTGSLPSNGDILLDFSDIENNVTNLTFIVTAKDEFNNTNQSFINFTVDKRAPQLIFGINDTNSSFIESGHIYNETNIDSGFQVTNAINSSFTIYDSQGLIKFKETQETVYAEDHNYTDLIYVGDWAEGEYVIQLNGENGAGPAETNPESREVYIDHSSPIIAQNQTMNVSGDAILTTVVASDSIYLSVNITDETLSLVNISFEYPNGTIVSKVSSVNETQNSTHYLDSGIYTFEVVDLHKFINKTLNWSVVAVDGNNDSTELPSSIFIESTPPIFMGAGIISILEDLSGTITLDDFFIDPDEDIDPTSDNLTYDVVPDPIELLDETLTVELINSTTGEYNITLGNDYVENITLIINVVDSYLIGFETQINISIIPVNDAPYFGGQIDNMSLTEDVSNISINLSEEFFDVDLDNLTYEYNLSNSNFTVVINDSTGIVNITPPANYSNSEDEILPTISFRAGDLINVSEWSPDITLNVTAFNDMPHIAPVITYPSSGEEYGGSINITWDAAEDIDNESLEYHVYFGFDSSQDITSFTNVANTTNNWYQWINSSYNVDYFGIKISAFDGLNYKNSTPVVVQLNVSTPGVDLYSPVNGGVYESLEIPLNFTVDELANCTIYLDGVVNKTYLNTLGNDTTINVSQGETVLNISCVDNLGTYGDPDIATFHALEDFIFIDNISFGSGWTFNDSGIDVALTLSSKNNIDSFNLTFILPNGSLSQYEADDFIPAISDADIEGDYNLSFDEVSQNGTYSIFINASDNESNLFDESYLNVFSSFEKVEQNVNVN